jgi:hypothetical protein
MDWKRKKQKQKTKQNKKVGCLVGVKKTKEYSATKGKKKKKKKLIMARRKRKILKSWW